MAALQYVSAYVSQERSVEEMLYYKHRGRMADFNDVSAYVA
jgi:hypothetical protein